RKWLQVPLDTDGFQKPMTLKEFLGRLIDRWGEKEIFLPILTDREAIQVESVKRLPKGDAFATPDAVWAFRIQLARLPRRATGDWLLRRALAQLPLNNVSYFIQPTHLEISTGARVFVAEWNVFWRAVLEEVTGPWEEVIEYQRGIVDTITTIRAAID